MKRIFNAHWLVCMTIWCFATLGFIIGIIVDSSFADDAIYAAIVLVVLFFSLLFRPISIDFDTKYLTIHFLFGRYIKMKWESIWKIERQAMPEDNRYYKVFGDGFGKCAFFTSPKIPYSRKVQNLLREYWKKDFKND